MLDENLQRIENFYETQLSSFLEQFHTLTLQVRAFEPLFIGTTLVETSQTIKLKLLGKFIFGFSRTRTNFFYTCRKRLFY